MSRTPKSAFSTPFKSHRSTKLRGTKSNDNKNHGRDILSGLSQDLMAGLLTSNPINMSLDQGTPPQRVRCTKKTMTKKLKLVNTTLSNSVPIVQSRKPRTYTPGGDVSTQSSAQSVQGKRRTNDIVQRIGGNMKVKQTLKQAKDSELPERNISLKKLKCVQEKPDTGSTEKRLKAKSSMYEFELSPQAHRKFLALKRKKSSKDIVKQKLLMLIAKTKSEMNMLREQRRLISTRRLKVRSFIEGIETSPQDEAIQVTVSSANQEIPLREKYSLKPGKKILTNSEVPRFVDHRHIPVSMAVSEI